MDSYEFYSLIWTQYEEEMLFFETHFFVNFGYGSIKHRGGNDFLIDYLQFFVWIRQENFLLEI